MINKNLRKENKDFFWSIVEPKCSHCGYNKCIEALHLHHINSAEKKNNKDTFGYWLSLSRYSLLTKLSSTKFSILCATCHIELHSLIRQGINVNVKQVDTAYFKDILETIKPTGKFLLAQEKINSKTKVCSKCKLEKDKSEFNKNKTHVDGYATWCKMCSQGKMPYHLRTFLNTVPSIPPNYYSNKIRIQEGMDPI